MTAQTKVWLSKVWPPFCHFSSAPAILNIPWGGRKVYFYVLGMHLLRCVRLESTELAAPTAPLVCHGNSSDFDPPARTCRITTKSELPAFRAARPLPVPSGESCSTTSSAENTGQVNPEFESMLP